MTAEVLPTVEIRGRSRSIGDKRTDYLPSLDGLRGFAVLWVILFHTFSANHSAQSGLANKLIERAAYSGWLGVDIFFVLSGFLITGILFDTRNNQNRFLNFYARRSLRILPLCYAFLAVATLFSIASGGWTLRPAISHWIFLSNFAFVGLGPNPKPFQHLWSLAIEEQYYLAWPWLVFFSSRITAMRVSVFLLVLSFGARMLLGINSMHSAAYVLTPAHVDGLVIGSWMALFVRGSGDRRQMAIWWIAAGAHFTLFVISWGHGLTFSENQAIVFGPLAIGVLTGGVVLWLSEGSAPRFLAASPLTQVGRYSYAIYVFQWPIILVQSHLWPAMPGSRAAPTIVLIAVVVAVTSYCVARCSWWLLERHFMALRRHFPSGRQDKPLTQRAADNENLLPAERLPASC